MIKIVTSTNKNKKYMVLRTNRPVVRRKSYLSRSAGIKNKAGELTKNNPNYANYWSRKYLW